MRKHRKLKITLIVVLLPFVLYFGYFLFFGDGFVALAHYNKIKFDGDNCIYNEREYELGHGFRNYFYDHRCRKLKTVSFSYSFPYCTYCFGDEYKNPQYIITHHELYFRKDLDYKSIKLELFYRVRESGKLTGDEVKVGNYSLNDITGKETKLKFGDFNEHYDFVAYFDNSYNDFVEVYNMIDVYKEDTYYIVYVNSECRTIYEVSTEFADLLNSLFEQDK